MNSIILSLHVVCICSLTLFALRFGKQVMVAWLSMLSVAMNLFVLKQITIFGLHVTASEALGVGYLLTLNLTQEFFGRDFARKCVWISVFISSSFLALSQLHLLYTPNAFDGGQVHYVALLTSMPRVILASLFTFLVVQVFDLALFAFLRKKTTGKYLTFRMAIALVCSQILDTLLFSYLGLYGLVASVLHVICFSLVIKGAVIALSTPFIALARKYEI